MTIKKLNLIPVISMTLGLLTVTCTNVCYKGQNDFPVTKQSGFSNILILGNSITVAPANPSIGWNNNWGMAATAPDSYNLQSLSQKRQYLKL